MKRILYLVTQTHYGGAQKYVHDLAINITQNHSDKYSVVVGVGEGQIEPWMSDITNEGIELIQLKHVKRNLHPIHDALSGFELLSLYKKVKPDIIHLNSSKIGATGAVAGAVYKLFTKQKIKIIYTVHGLVLNEPLNPLRKSYYWFAEWFGGLFKDMLISVSHQSKEAIAKWKVAPLKKVHVVHNGIDLHGIIFKDQATARSEINQHTELAIKPEDTVIGSIAGLYKTKGLNHFIESARILLDSFPDDIDKSSIKFVVIGEGPENTYLYKLIEKHSLKNNFILAGSIPDAPNLLKAFDVFVLPSVKEGLSYTLIEARAAELPIVATNVGGNPEVISHEQTGLLVPSHDPKRLSNAIKNLMFHTQTSDTLAHNAIKNIDAFSIDAMTSRTSVYYT